MPPRRGFKKTGKNLLRSGEVTPIVAAPVSPEWVRDRNWRRRKLADRLAAGVMVPRFKLPSGNTLSLCQSRHIVR